jgi:hypothetical protein
MSLQLKLLASTGSALLVCALLGCATPGAMIGKLRALAPKDAGTPATVEKRESSAKLEAPAGTQVRVERTEPVPATADTKFSPGRTLTEWTFPDTAVFTFDTQQARASSGTVDTTVAKHRIDVAERRWLLWTAIACGLAGIVVRSLVPAWPALSNGLLAGAALAFASWKFSEIPAWLWLVALGVVAALALGYKRAEWDRDGDGIPDRLQSKIENQKSKIP